MINLKTKYSKIWNEANMNELIQDVVQMKN